MHIKRRVSSDGGVDFREFFGGVNPNRRQKGEHAHIDALRENVTKGA